MEILKEIFMCGLLCVGIATCLYIIFAIINAYFETKRRIKHEKRMEAYKEVEAFMKALGIDEEEIEEVEPKKEAKKKSKK